MPTETPRVDWTTPGSAPPSLCAGVGAAVGDGIDTAAGEKRQGHRRRKQPGFRRAVRRAAAASRDLHPPCRSFHFASGCRHSPRSGTPARRYHRPEGGFPVSPGAYLPRTDAGPPGSPPWRALLRRRPSRWLPSAVVMSESASVEKRSAGAAPQAAQAAQAAECRAAATAVADRAKASSAREHRRHERQAAAS